MIVPMMPHDFETRPSKVNLGRAYNMCMERLRDDDWGVLLDHDVALTTKAWYHQIAEAIAFRPDAGMFGAVTNRINAFWQQAGDPNNFDLEYHYAFGESRRRQRTLLDVTDTKGIGGVLLCLSKRVWQEVGGFKDGLLCVDHGMHFALRDRGYRVYLIEGLYLQHRRRAFGAELPEETPRAANCPCRGPEPLPIARLTLPEAA